MILVRMTGRGVFPNGIDVGGVGRMNPGDVRAMPLGDAEAHIRDYPNDFEVVKPERHVDDKDVPPPPDVDPPDVDKPKPKKPKPRRPKRVRKPFGGFDTKG